MIRFAIFASGSGSNAENIICYFDNHKNIKPALVISNKPNAYVSKRAEMMNIPYLYIPSSDFKNNPSNVLEQLESYNIRFIVLAGFLVLIPAELISHYRNKIINIHPALLPAYGGKGMYGDRVHKAVIDAGETQSGISIHYVNEVYDAGKLIFQTTCPVSKHDTPETLAEKVHELEYIHYPAVIEQTIRETFNLQ